MVDLIDDLKQRARVLHRSAQAGDAGALARLRAVPELRTLDDAELRAAARRRHALAALAVALGFRGWSHAKSVLTGDDVADRGTLMHRESGGSYWNVWSASYEEARAIRADHGGWLLPYRHQFFIVEDHYIEALGLDPADPDWDRIGRDWLDRSDPAAWTRLAAAAIDSRLGRT